MSLSKGSWLVFLFVLISDGVEAEFISFFTLPDFLGFSKFKDQIRGRVFYLFYLTLLSKLRVCFISLFILQ